MFVPIRAIESWFVLRPSSDVEGVAEIGGVLVLLKREAVAGIGGDSEMAAEQWSRRRR